MAFNLANPIGTGTDAELLEFTRAAIAQITLHGKAHEGPDGRSLTRADLPDLWKQVAILERRVNVAAGLSAENVVRFKRA